MDPFGNWHDELRDKYDWYNNLHYNPKLSLYSWVILAVVVAAFFQLHSFSLEDIDTYLAQFGYKNLGCLSGFSYAMAGWDGTHNDYLYAKS